MTAPDRADSQVDVATTVGLVHAVIAVCRRLVEQELDDPQVRAALAELAADPDVELVLAEARTVSR